ncbi:oxygenase MpaB family protein [Streptomyces sp. NPDC021020]|uniref:oxygenase MpaB family protein n=1 Tax=Streptomyces sp. NPDC021020 TaxID=3365109 RepID=UPI0037ACD739
MRPASVPAPASRTAVRRGPLRALDHGLFGPGSVSWKVWAAPTSLVGFQRAIVLEHLDPLLAAAAADSGGMYRNPHGRFDQTFGYLLTVALGDARTAVRTAEAVTRIHTRVTGTDPVTGRRYSANNPASQLWVHIVAWESMQACYEAYGPGRLSHAEDRRYWAECATAAGLQTCAPADVPRSRAEVAAYYAGLRPGLCTSERANDGMRYLLWPPLSSVGPRLGAVSRVTAALTVATMPDWFWRVTGFPRPRATAAAVRLGRPLLRRAMRLAGRPALAVPLTASIAPTCGHVLREHFAAQDVAEAVTLTVGEARSRYSARRPRERAGGALRERPGAP